MPPTHTKKLYRFRTPVVTALERAALRANRSHSQWVEHAVILQLLSEGHITWEKAQSWGLATRPATTRRTPTRRALQEA